VDRAVWKWVQAFLTEPEVLETGLREAQREREEENAPMRTRLRLVDDLLMEKRGKLARLLDLYLGGEFDRRLLEDRKARLDAEIEGLERERGVLVARLEARTLSDHQVVSLRAFAEEMAEQLEMLQGDFATQRRLVEQLDIQITLVAREDLREIHISCLLGEHDVDVSCNTGEERSQSISASSCV
jgi:hypothetical protein